MFTQAQRTTAISTVALVLSGVAIYYSAKQWEVGRDQLETSRTQLLLSMKPSINYLTENDPDDIPVGIKVDNAGPGPATIKTFTYFLDKKPIGGDGANVLEMIGLSNAKNIINTDMEPDDTMAVGESEWLIQYKSLPHNRQQRRELQKLVDLLDNQLAVEIEFCPVLGGKCEKKCSSKGMCE